jgi:nicotinamidase-related amidase
VTTVDDHAALVLIDLQQGILDLPVLTAPEQILAESIRLAEAFRAHQLPVVRVRVAWSADAGDLPHTRTAIPGPSVPPPAAFAAFPAAFPPHPDDILIVKRHWGAFTGTELDLQLRRRGVTHIVLAGISTSIGVESTARAAWEHSYNLTIVSDATTDTDADSHAHSFTKIFPRIAEIATTDEIITAIKA